MQFRQVVGLGFLGLGLIAASPGDDRSQERGDHALRVAEVRSRSRLPASVASRYDVEVGTNGVPRARPVLPEFDRRAVPRPARVTLPMRASGATEIEDATSGISLRFTLDHVQDTPIAFADGMALYRGALDGADVLHRVHAAGTEDYVVFEERPAREDLSYTLDVSRVPGLRLVSNTLEVIDWAGTPVLRVAPPYVVDASGARHEARLAVEECAHDTSAAGPWGRPVTAPGRDRCTVRVAWSGVTYPAMVDPAWQATGLSVSTRDSGTATVLLSGKVLVAGGQRLGVYRAAAELFDPTSRTFAATGTMKVARASGTASLLSSGNVLVAGGCLSASTSTDRAELYDPTAGSFTETPLMTAARCAHAAIVAPSGNVYIVGGGTKGGEIQPTSELEYYDPTGGGSFVKGNATLTARQTHTATLLPAGKVLIAGGYGFGSVYFDAAELLDPAANGNKGSTSPAATMKTARGGHTATLLPSGKVLVAGGAGNGVILGSAEIYDPTTSVFSATGAMTTLRAGHTSTLLPSGVVLVAGGYGTAVEKTVELFDPGANGGAGLFATTVPMATPRAGHTASPLASGKVLVTGGDDDGKSEIYGSDLGDKCTSNAACLSGFCVEGACCSRACDKGPCERCDLAGSAGTCTVAPAGYPGSPACAAPYLCDGVTAACATACTTDASCVTTHHCGPSGTCEPRRAVGAACQAADCKTPPCSQCLSGFCVDGFCCESACNGTCEACAAALKYENAGNGKCGDAKAEPDGTACGLTQGKCDGDRKAIGADGVTRIECFPYRCNDGLCGKTCTSLVECASPAVCNPVARCEVPAPPLASSGCAIGPPSPRGPAWILLGLAILAGRARRRGRG